MYEFTVRIGAHYLLVSTESEHVKQWFANAYGSEERSVDADLSLHVEGGYGLPFVDNHYTVHQKKHLIIYERKDYRLVTTSDYKETVLAVHDEFSLRHAMMNLYSAFIVHIEWGLLLHSSCVIDDERAWIFCGKSGAGKSTAARLSNSRQLFSDEASILRIRKGQVDVLDSPFRSEIASTHKREAFPVAGVHLLIQSPQIRQELLGAGEAVTRLIDKVFYWSYNSAESNKIMKLLTQLIQSVPVYELEFQKNDRFWEVITCPLSTDGILQPNVQN